jgi:cation:H+ antiporter
MAGLVGLFLGGEALVRGSVSIAHKMSISPLVIGLTVVGFGTSTPELLVSVQAALKGVPDIAIGNIVGSNIANVLLIVGLTALVWPIHVAGSALRRDTTIMILSALALVPLFAMGEIGRVAGLTLVAGLIAYLVWTFLKPRQEASDDEAEAAATPIMNALLWVTLGLVGLLFGARFLVDGAVSVAQDFGVSEAFIGLTIVAIGTSLPELATSLIAAFRHQSDIAIGNIVGSNIFNVLGILGVTSIVAPIPVAPRFLTFDLPIMIVVSIVLTGLLLLHQKIGRRTGAVMLLAYCAYLLTAH